MSVKSKREPMRVIRARRIASMEIIATVQDLETRAHAAGLHVTGHALNNAKNTVGWESAGNVIAAGLASRGRRVGDKGIR
jgi:hypothetical protein